MAAESARQHRQLSLALHGCRACEVDDFEGERFSAERFSVVYFSAGKFWKATEEQWEFLEMCGLSVPEG